MRLWEWWIGSRWYRSRAVRYGAAIVLLVLTILLRVVAEQVIPLGAVFIFSYLGAMAAALLLGLGPAMLFVLLAAGAQAVWGLPPVGSFRIDRSSDRAMMLLFVLVGAVMTLIGAAYREGLRRMHDKNTALDQCNQQVTSLQKRSRALGLRLTVTEAHERRRIASELHDHLGQLLLAARLKIAVLSREDESPLDRNMIQDVGGIIDESVKYVRTLITDLSPPVLFEHGLPAALAWLSGQMKQRFDLTCSITQQAEFPALSEENSIVLFQAVRELLMNVTKHAGVSEATVTLSCDAMGRGVVEVTDRGVGFHFEQYGERDGFGMFHLIERMEAVGGTVDVQSAPGRGTRVLLVVPVKPDEAADQEEASCAVDQVQALASTEVVEDTMGELVIRVLLADDYDLVREGLRTILEDSGGLDVVGEARNGEEAVQMAEALRPDVVLMDVSMPGLNGLEATRRIKQNCPGVAVIGLSVHHDKELAEEFKRAGATAYLTKGGPADEIVESVRIAGAAVAV